MRNAATLLTLLTLLALATASSGCADTRVDAEGDVDPEDDVEADDSRLSAAPDGSAADDDDPGGVSAGANTGDDGLDRADGTGSDPAASEDPQGKPAAAEPGGEDADVAPEELAGVDVSSGDDEIDGAAAFAAQAEAGAATYGRRCAGCHGTQGQGGGGTRLIGADALPLDTPPGRSRDAQFLTALDVYSWALDNMPPGGAGSVGEPAMLEVVAFLLQENGIEPEAVLTVDHAADVVIN